MRRVQEAIESELRRLRGEAGQGEVHAELRFVGEYGVIVRVGDAVYVLGLLRRAGIKNVWWHPVSNDGR